MLLLSEAHTFWPIAITFVMANLQLPSFFRRASGPISRTCIPNKLGVQGEIPVRDREVEHGHWRARDDISAILFGPPCAGLLLYRPGIFSRTDVAGGSLQNLSQLNA